MCLKRAFWIMPRPQVPAAHVGSALESTLIQCKKQPQLSLGLFVYLIVFARGSGVAAAAEADTSKTHQSEYSRCWLRDTSEDTRVDVRIVLSDEVAV